MKTGFYTDIYVLVNDRNIITIEHFLNEFTDRKSIEETPDCEIALFQNNEYKYIKSESLSNSIKFGLSNTKNCFSLYLKSKNDLIKSVILTFTEDNKLVLGLSIAEIENDDYHLASKFGLELKTNYNSKEFIFGTEIPPPLNEEEFNNYFFSLNNQNNEV